MSKASSQRVRAYYDREARNFDASMGPFERWLLKDGRAWAASHAVGDVLEIGIGTGRNLQYYPAGVHLVGVEMSPAMLAFARERASQLGMQVDLHEGDAEALAFPDASFDTVIGTVVLCSIPDDRRAIAEMARVLKPGGLAVLVEHVRSPVWPVRMLEHVLEPLMLRLECDHLLRDPVDHLEHYGLHIEVCERSGWGIMERTLARKMSPAQV
jgi:ubiquinone/menaquinone biosynthesis C-methylase UbiE